MYIWYSLLDIHAHKYICMYYFAQCSPIYNFVSMFSIYLLFCNNNRATQQKILDDNQEWQTFHSGSFIWLLDIFVITRKGPNGPVRQTYLLLHLQNYQHIFLHKGTFSFSFVFPTNYYTEDILFQHKVCVSLVALMVV